MKLRPTLAAVGLCLLGTISLPVYADSQAGGANEQQVIDNLTQRTSALQEQVSELQSELKQIKRSSMTREQTQVRVRTIIVHEVPVGHSYAQYAGAVSHLPPEQNPLIKAPIGGSPSGPPIKPYALLSNAPLTFGGIPVLTSPYLGERSEFDASDLVSFLPYINEDYHILTERQKIEDVYKSYCEPLPDSPFLDFSGELQGTAMYSKQFNGTSASGFDLPTAELFAMGGINRWVTAFMGIAFDNNPPESLTPPQLGPDYGNSRIFLDQGFITVGNLNSSPIYGTIGQVYVPFGSYTTYQISNPLTEDVGRTKARAVTLGYDQPWTYYGLDAQIFAFKGFAAPNGDESQVINNGGANFDYTWNKGIWTGYFGASYLINLADSLDMQQNEASTGFLGFGGNVPPPNPESLVHRVPAAGVHANFAVGPLSLIGEYISATTEFSPDNLTYCGHGADVKAGQVEAVYTFKINNLPTNIALGYQQTSDALALLAPLRRYTATFNINLLKDTLESIEFRHDINYPGYATAAGQGLLVSTAGMGLGHSDNTVTGELTVYF